jgi:hypothetical protein
VEVVPILAFASKKRLEMSLLKDTRLWRFCLCLVLHRGHHPYREEGQIVRYPGYISRIHQTGEGADGRTISFVGSKWNESRKCRDVQIKKYTQSKNPNPKQTFAKKVGLIRARNLCGDCPRNPPSRLANCPFPRLPLIMAAIHYPERGFKFDNYQRYTNPELATNWIEIFH